MEDFKKFEDIDWAQVVTDVVGFLKDVVVTLAAFLDGFKKTYAFQEEVTE